MQTLCAATDSPALLDAAVARASALLAAGEPVALPTETVYGLAADALRPEAVAKIFEAKERPFFDPLIVHLPDREWLEKITAIPEENRALVEALTARFWPGPLTLVLPRKRSLVPDLVTSGLETVAVRMSAHPVFSAVARHFGKPLAAPSANRFGRISPTAAAHVMSELEGRIALVVDGGPTTHGVESTIVGLEPGGTLRILRSGPITREELAAFAPVQAAAEGQASKLEAPGQLASHYAPRTPLRIGWHGAPIPEGENCGLLAWTTAIDGFTRVEILSASGDLREAAATLFAKMRALDESGVDLILVEPLPENGLGVAIMDRLRRAAHNTGTHAEPRSRGGEGKGSI